MKVYLASWFASKDEMKLRAIQLRDSGIEVTSRWLDETVKPTTAIKDVSEDYLRETAQVDLHDVIIANVVVLNVPSEYDLKTADMPVSSWARGGRHFEAGFQYAMMVFLKYLPVRVQARGFRQLVLVGHKENVFHYLDGLKELLADDFDLPEIQVFETWEQAKSYLIEVAGADIKVSKWYT